MTSLLFALLLGQTAPAPDPAGATEGSAEVAQAPVAPATDEKRQADELLRRQYTSLRAFADGEAVEALDAYFDVNLDDLAEVQARIKELEGRVKSGEDDPQLEVDGLRLELLSTWESTLRKMSNPARRALATLREPQRALRASARRVEELEGPLARVAGDLGGKTQKAENGGLIGFRTDVMGFVDAAELSQQAFRASATLARRRAAEMLGGAKELEQRSAAIRSRFLAAGLRGERDDIDREFVAAVGEQRTLRRALGELNVIAFEKAVTRSLDALPKNAERLRAATDTRSANAALSDADTELAEVNGQLSDADRLTTYYELQVFREVVTMLTAVASEAARDRAYPLGTELIGDIESELQALWSGAVAYATGQRERLTNERMVFELAPLLLGIVLILVVGSLLERRAARAVTLLVQPLARTPAFRGRVGSLVRWAGLFQAIAPTLVIVVTGYAVFFWIGFDRVEVQFLEIGFRWFALYYFGRNALEGAVRRVSAGRPALIDASDETADKLRRSYNQVGLVFAIAATVEEWARTLLALGRVRALIETGVALWAGLWLLYVCLSWRQEVSSRLLETSEPDSVWHRAGAWMGQRYAGTALVIPGALRLLFLWLWKGLSVVLLQQGVFAYLKARALRIQAQGSESPPPEDTSLPNVYADQFPLYPVLGEIDTVLVQQPDEVDPILAQINVWKSSRRDSSLAIVGAKGIGKTTLMALVRHRINQCEVVSTTLTERLLHESDVVRVLAPIFGAEEVGSLRELSAALNDGPDRVAIVDDAHLAFLRVVNGYRGFDSLVDLVTQTSAKVFWLLTFNDYAWAFLNAAHGRRAYFRRVRRVHDWTSEELRNLIGRRTKRAGFELDFDQQLLDDSGYDGSGDLRIVEGAEGFFRMLWEASRGNPRAATSLWLRSLALKADKKLRVQLFSEAKTEALKEASDDVFFALASITQHENLTADELTETLNVNESVSSYALRYLSEYGVIGPKFGAPDRYTIQVRYYWEVVQSLRARNQLYREIA